MRAPFGPPFQGAHPLLALSRGVVSQEPRLVCSAVLLKKPRPASFVLGCFPIVNIFLLTFARPNGLFSRPSPGRRAHHASAVVPVRFSKARVAAAARRDGAVEAER